MAAHETVLSGIHLTLGELTVHVTIYPPLVICTWLVFWLGFEWAFLPAFLAALAQGLFTGMALPTALLFGLADPLGLAVYAVVYHVARRRYDLRSVRSVLIFVAASFVGAGAGASGSFLWSHSHGLSAVRTMATWEGWWIGALLQAMLINAPVLCLVGPRVEQLKRRLFNMPERPRITRKWLIAVAALGGATVVGFVAGTVRLASLRLEAGATALDGAAREQVLAGISTVQALAVGIVLLLAAISVGAVYLALKWNRSLRDRVQAQTDALRQSARRFQEMVEGASAVLYRYDLADDRFDYVTPGAEAVLGLSSDQLREDPANLLKVVPPDWHEYLRVHLQKLKQGEGPRRYQYPVRNGSGRCRWVQDRARLLRDESGEAVSVQGVITDVTELHDVQSQLREEHRLLARIMQTSPVAITVVAETGEITFANRKAEELFGLSRSEVVGRAYNASDWQITDAEGRPVPDEDLPFRRVMRTGEPVFDLQHAVVRPDGQRIYLSINGSPLETEEGEIEGVVFSMEDVTDRHRNLQALRESEAKYRTLFESVPVGLYRTTPAGEILRANSTLADMLGYADTTALREVNVTDLYVDPRQRKEFRSRIESRGVVRGFEIRLRRKDGQIIWVSLNGRLVRGEHGTPQYYEGSLEEITERRAAQKALRERERRLSTLLSNLPGMAYRCIDDAQYTMEFVSEGAGALTGYEPAGLVGNAEVAFADLIHPQDRSKVRGRVDVAVADDRPFRLQYRVRTESGEYRWVQELGRPVGRDEDGNMRLEGFILDVTERVEARRAYRRSHGRFRLAAEGADNGLWVWPDVEEDGMWWSGKVYELLGYARGAFESRFSEFLDLLSPEDRPRLVDAVEEDLEKGEPLDVELQARTRSGEPRWFHVRGKAEWDEEAEAMRMAGTVSDVTERRQVEEKLRRSRENLRALARRLQRARENERKRLARDIHDELGHSLTALKMDISRARFSLLESDAGVEAAQLAEELAGAVRTVDSTIETVRRMSSRLRPGVLDDLGLTAALEWHISDFCERSDVDYSFTYSPEDLQVGERRATAFFRICQEILTNAVRHGEADRIDVRVEEGPECVILTAHNDGRAIDRESLAGSDGAGIVGMRERAAQFGGRVEIESEPGEGTTVRVSIPGG
ncbi:MAG: PAS domain S-box protein [Planctomycetota bacterium]